MCTAAAAAAEPTRASAPETLHRRRPPDPAFFSSPCSNLQPIMHAYIRRPPTPELLLQSDLVVRVQLSAFRVAGGRGRCSTSLVSRCLSIYMVQWYDACVQRGVVSWDGLDRGLIARLRRCSQPASKSGGVDGRRRRRRGWASHTHRGGDSGEILTEGDHGVG